jgi:fucose permease
VRGGDPGALGYVTSGFWCGMTLGRFVLTPFGQKVGEKLFIYGLVAGSLVLELLVWLVPNVISNAVFIAIIGLPLGPCYPTAMLVFTKTMTRQQQVSRTGIISAFGSFGGAVAPFTTGMIAQAVGPFVLHPIAIGLFVVMMCCWFVIPGIEKRKD